MTEEQKDKEKQDNGLTGDSSLPQEPGDSREEDNVPNEESQAAIMQRLKVESEKNLAGWQRAQADYQNLKRETEERYKRLQEFSLVVIFQDVLPVVDTMIRGITHIPKDLQETDWARGFLQVKKQFDDLLKKYDIEKIVTVGAMFNPSLHEAVFEEDHPERQPLEILDEVQAGYYIHGTLLFPAKVIINKQRIENRTHTITDD